MTTKQTIVAELGKEQILAPERIALALIANDRIKYYLTLLQTACANTNQPRVPTPDLKAERLASNLADAWLDEVVAGTRREPSGSYRVPHLAEILERAFAALDTMIACLPETEQSALRARMDKLPRTAPKMSELKAEEIVNLTRGDRKAGDSMHLIVMDAHRAINRVQADTVIETIDGARAHRLSAEGRQRVQAFMAGLNRTAFLKFDHPGLATTATEYEQQVLIQNDIGVTDAHVLVIRVQGLVVTVTYTDIHRNRLKFFQDLFTATTITWAGTEHRRSERLVEGNYLLSTGLFEAQDEGELDHFLSFLGSRIVFLIDWNKMRKRLQLFVDRTAAIGILKWSADHDYGHRALLEVGGEQTLGEAVEFAAGGTLRYGQRLDALISSDAAIEFLKDALRIASTGLRQRRSRRNIQDEIKARLAGSFETQRLGVFELAGDHAALGYDLATMLVETLSRMSSGVAGDHLSAVATRASAWEAKADQILNEARADIRRFARPRSLRDFFEFADDAIDELEEAAAVLELAGLSSLNAVTIERLQEIAELALLSCQDIVRSVACAAYVTRPDLRDDLDEFLSASERLIQTEHRADDALRGFRRWLMKAQLEPLQILVLRDFAAALEAATDAYAHAAQELRTYLMEEVIAQ
ncbi:MAG: DUF47 family protein [Chromatiaceae bacterium]|nr:MAG: DUF47 family protein [Phycisphaerales bacterium]TVQ94759.1 MAG: DUF47 family protein [Chromatiaceae bacterium]